MVVHRSAAERSIVIKGKLNDLLAAFPADVRMYHHSTGTYRGRQGVIHIPQQLDGIVTGIFGVRSRVRSIGCRGGGNPREQSREPRMGWPLRISRQSCYLVSPRSSGESMLDGSGQTVAIIELGGGYRNSDLTVFFNEIGVALPVVSAVSVDHAGNDPTTADSDDGEVMLDIEVAGAVAPKANYVIYFAPNNGDQGFIDAISAAIHDTQRNPSVISISWGGPEDATDQQGITAFHELFVAAAAVGITICVASGDHGTADLDATHWDGKMHVDHPAVDDFVLGCGGTQIRRRPGRRMERWHASFRHECPGTRGWLRQPEGHQRNGDRRAGLSAVQPNSPVSRSITVATQAGASQTLP